jgi:hypothetical protein
MKWQGCDLTRGVHVVRSLSRADDSDQVTNSLWSWVWVIVLSNSVSSVSLMLLGWCARPNRQILDRAADILTDR